MIFRILVVATATLAVSAPSASADTQYGGTGFNAKRVNGPPITLVRRDDGRVDVRLTTGFFCRKASLVNRVVRLSGRTADGVSFTSTGTTPLTRRIRVRYTLTGTLAPDGVTGKLKVSARGCPGYTLGVVLKPESAPVGAPAPAPRNALLGGLTAQTMGGFRLPVAIKVTKSGRVYGNWVAAMKCGPKAVLSAWNATPTTAVKADGSFSRTEVYTVRYSDGSRDRFRVNFAGRFVADGAVGTLRMRMHTRKKGHRYYPCDSGTQTWSARP